MILIRQSYNDYNAATIPPGNRVNSRVNGRGHVDQSQQGVHGTCWAPAVALAANQLTASGHCADFRQ
jgi:hypothetical protein